MINYNIRASFGNKDFIHSVMAALFELRADEFINLFLKAEDQSIYKISKGEKDPQTRLFIEIIHNLSGMGLERDHGELILQALCAAPSISELSKLMATLSVGATLEYKDFARLFGKGGDFSLSSKKNRTYKIQEEIECARYAFTVGLMQSDDVRFLIDKFKIIEKAFSTDSIEKFLSLPHINLFASNLDADPFFQLLDALPEHKRPSLMHYAPASVFASERVLDLFDRGYIRSCGDMTPILTRAFNAENGVLVTKAADQILGDGSSGRGHDQLNDLLLRINMGNLTDRQVLIKNELIKQINAHELDIAKTHPVMFNSNVPGYLLRAYNLGHLDHFTNILLAVNDDLGRRGNVMGVFMEIVDGEQRIDITEDHVKMVSLLKEKVFEWMSGLADTVKVGAKDSKPERHGRHPVRREVDFGPRS
jgi:hypothetical protein